MKTQVHGMIDTAKLQSRGDREDLWVAVIRAMTDLGALLREIQEAETLEDARELSEKALIALEELESERVESLPQDLS